MPPARRWVSYLHRACAARLQDKHEHQPYRERSPDLFDRLGPPHARRQHLSVLSRPYVIHCPPYSTIPLGRPG